MYPSRRPSPPGHYTAGVALTRPRGLPNAPTVWACCRPRKTGKIPPGLPTVLHFSAASARTRARQPLTRSCARGFAPLYPHNPLGGASPARCPPRPATRAGRPRRPRPLPGRTTAAPPTRVRPSARQAVLPARPWRRHLLGVQQVGDLARRLPLGIEPKHTSHDFGLGLVNDQFVPDYPAGAFGAVAALTGRRPEPTPSGNASYRGCTAKRPSAES